MNRRLLICLTVLFTAACATIAPSDKPGAQALLGMWTVDLRPSPGAPAHLKTFDVRSVSGNTFQGTFYDTEIAEGRINVEWGAVRIAFVTSDGSGPYNHSATLIGGKLEGLTNSIGRGFLAYWSATKP